MAEMARPVARADRARDQAVGGGGIGNAQQRLGEAEQQHPLLARQAIFVQEKIDPAALRAAFPRRLDQVKAQASRLRRLLLD